MCSVLSDYIWKRSIATNRVSQPRNTKKTPRQISDKTDRFVLNIGACLSQLACRDKSSLSYFSFELDLHRCLCHGLKTRVILCSNIRHCAKKSLAWCADFLQWWQLNVFFWIYKLYSSASGVSELMGEAALLIEHLPADTARQVRYGGLFADLHDRQLFVKIFGVCTTNPHWEADAWFCTCTFIHKYTQTQILSHTHTARSYFGVEG